MGYCVGAKPRKAKLTRTGKPQAYSLYPVKKEEKENKQKSKTRLLQFNSQHG